MTRALASVKAANAYIPPAHVTLGSFSTRGFTRAAITIITGSLRLVSTYVWARFILQNWFNIFISLCKWRTQCFRTTLSPFYPRCFPNYILRSSWFFQKRMTRQKMNKFEYMPLWLTPKGWEISRSTAQEISLQTNCRRIDKFSTNALVSNFCRPQNFPGKRKRTYPRTEGYKIRFQRRRTRKKCTSYAKFVVALTREANLEDDSRGLFRVHRRMRPSCASICRPSGETRKGKGREREEEDRRAGGAPSCPAAASKNFFEPALKNCSA